MKRIGGNITANIQTKSKIGTDRLGKPTYEWTTVHYVVGFLDLRSGDSRYTTYNAKIEESSHVFICDYFPTTVKPGEARVIIEDKEYDLKLIDDPMNLHEHYEMFLSFVG